MSLIIWVCPKKKLKLLAMSKGNWPFVFFLISTVYLKLPLVTFISAAPIAFYTSRGPFAHLKRTQLEFFLNGAELSLNSVNLGNQINHWSTNWAQFKDLVSHMGLAGTVITSFSLTQELAGSSRFTVMTKFFFTFRKNSNVPSARIKQLLFLNKKTNLAILLFLPRLINLI